ncbi:Domain of unknown function (DUF3508) [Nesidiocoris tenuis]|uniref:Cilia- and flagella-associated protein 206 n=1 Tax=Nesidiocoris tenuis TaxID=355587 RepID=A0ABN7AQW3_9HEMI|nr:Domain of unknown function (DUF3508) [Nesidiocoris tenuis]
MQVQAYYCEGFKSEDHVLEQHSKLLNSYAEPLVRSVLSKFTVRPEYAIIHRHLVFLTIIMTGMGDPTDDAVFREAGAALESVMSAQDIVKFTQLNQSQKRRQLQEIIKIVAGIRIYNRAKISQTIPGLSEPDDINDLPKLIVSSLTSLKNSTEQNLSALAKSVANLERAMEDSYEWDFSLESPLKCSKPYFEDDRDFETAKKLLILWHQVSIILRKMLENISRNLGEQVKSNDDMKNKILLMMEKLAYKVGVPSREVFPDFLELYQFWKGCQRRLVLVNKYDKMLKKMEEYKDVHNLQVSVKRAAEEEFWIPDASIRPIDVASKSVEVIVVKPAPDVEFNRFCPVYLTLADGLMLTTNLEIGVLKYLDRFYSFRDANAAELFSKSPERVLYSVYMRTKQNPELVEILDLRKELIFGWGIEDITRQGKPTSKKDVTVQTELHPTPENRDFRYRHSIWQLKMDACHQVSLRHKKTSSSQTWFSNQNLSVKTQTCQDREIETRSMSDKFTESSAMRNVIIGHGSRDEKQRIFTLRCPMGLMDLHRQP